MLDCARACRSSGMGSVSFPNARSLRGRAHRRMPRSLIGGAKDREPGHADAVIVWTIGHRTKVHRRTHIYCSLAGNRHTHRRDTFPGSVTTLSSTSPRSELHSSRAGSPTGTLVVIWEVLRYREHRVRIRHPAPRADDRTSAVEDSVPPQGCRRPCSRQRRRFTHLHSSPDRSQPRSGPVAMPSQSRRQ